MPVLMVVGDEDKSTPVAHQQVLFDVIPGEKELHIIQGSNHVFSKPHERAELKEIVQNWLKKS